MKKTQYNKLKLWRCRNMDDITKSLLDIKEKISSIEISSVENLKQILENTSEIKKIIDEITKKQ